MKIVCAVRKSLFFPTNLAQNALENIFLSFSPRFCSTFKKYCKSRLKIEILHFKDDTLHTCSDEKRFLEIDFEKTTVVRTRVQSATATLHFTAVL